MKTTAKHNERIATMTFSSVYPHYLTKVEKKGRTKEELHQVIEWLTGFDEKKLQNYINDKSTFKNFTNKRRGFFCLTCLLSNSIDIDYSKSISKTELFRWD